MDPVTHDRITELSQGDIQWDVLIDLARAHAIGVFLHQHLRSLDSGIVPRQLIQGASEFYMENIKRNLFMVGELRKVLTAFTAAEIPILTYKGPVLAEMAYKSLSLRRFSDLDLLIHKSDFQRAKDIFLSLGYTPRFQLDPNQEAMCLRYDNEYGFKHPGGVVADLHWRVSPRELNLVAFENSLWERSLQVKLAGIEVTTLSLVDHMLVVCLHGSKPDHGWFRLNWICDTAELAGNFQEADWEQLVMRAASLGVGRMVYLGLYLAHDLLGARLPGDVLDAIQSDSAIPPLADQIYQRIFQVSDRVPGVLESALFYLRARDIFGESILHTFRRIFAPTQDDWGTISLPRPLYFLYRPIRLLTKNFFEKE
jgi:hypothetical protein